MDKKRRLMLVLLRKLNVVNEDVLCVCDVKCG